jgi:hypothetical protein
MSYRWLIFLLGLSTGLGFRVDKEAIPMSQAIEGVSTAGISFEVAARVQGEQLQVGYRFKNDRQQSVFLFNVLWDTNARGDIVAAPSPVYVSLPQQAILRLSQQVPPLPKGKRVERRIVPFATKVPPGEAASKIYTLALPLQEYNPYFPAEDGAPEELITARELVFTLQFVVRMDGMDIREAPLSGALELFHPQLLARVETIQCHPQPLEVRVRRRLNKFEEF